jgi:predicted Zn finger-like uncharacterized protein
MSNMFTTCPNCKLNLAVTAQDLRIGQGYVRCGRCERVFNALIALCEDVSSAEQSGLAATGTTTLPIIEEPVEESLKISDAATEEFDSTATGTFETIVLEGDGVLSTEEELPEAQFDEQLQQIADRIEADDFAHVRRELGVEEHTGENVIIEYVSEDDRDEEYLPVDADAAVGNPPRPHWGWGLAAGLLAIALLGQVVHHHRQSLVAQPWAESAMRSIYGLFGNPLEPQWDLRAYDVRQLGGEPVPGVTDKLLLRASVHNRSDHRQPPPMIRVTLQDRFGNALVTHEVAPQDYVQGDTPSRMQADQRLDAEMLLDDPNRQAVGFELDACLPTADKRLRCSNDL